MTVDWELLILLALGEIGKARKEAPNDAIYDDHKRAQAG